MEKEKKEKDLNNCDCGCDCGDNCDCGCDCGDNCECGDDCDCGCGDDCECHSHANKDNKPGFCSCSGKCSGKGIFGLVVLAFGVLYLGKNMGWWSFDMNWSIFWPIVVIICGLTIIVKSRK